MVVYNSDQKLYGRMEASRQGVRYFTDKGVEVDKTTFDLLSEQHLEDLDKYMPTQEQVNDAATRDYTAEGEAYLAKKRRDRIAEGFAYSLACMMDAEPCAVSAVQYADALIAELDRA